MLCIDGGAAELSDVQVHGLEQLDGVAVCGWGSKAKLLRCTVTKSAKIGVFATEGGYAELVDCEVGSGSACCCS